MQRSRRRTLPPALLAFALLTAAAAPARADFFSTLAAGALTVCAVADTPFTIYDIAVAAKGQVPSTGWAAAEIAVSVPQVLGFQTLLAIADVEKDKDDTPLSFLALVPAIGTTSMLVHGSWATSNPRVRPGLLAIGSPMIAADMSFTITAIAHAYSRRLTSRPLAVAQIAFTLPQLIAGATILRRDDPAMLPTERNTWIAITAWSSVLVAHGVASAIVGSKREISSASSDPDPEPEPDDDPAPRAPQPPPPGDRKAPLYVPASIRVGPTMVSDGVARGPGIGVVGVF